VSRDAKFGEAWLAPGRLHESEYNLKGALECCARAVSAAPEDPDALYTLALLLTRRDAYDEALPVWSRYLAHAPNGKNRPRALRLMSLCRVSSRGDRERRIT
jgi:tetratricopeptide (TPR) repeat protein